MHSSGVTLVTSLENHQDWLWSKGVEGNFPTSSQLKAAQQSQEGSEYFPYKVILYFYHAKKVFHLETKTPASGRS